MFLFPSLVVLFSIAFYQKFLSPDHSFWAKKIYPYGFCKYIPSCSTYAHHAIEKHGIVKGSFKALWRVLRCNPWSRGGMDAP